jgi:hypothetical protein
LESRGGPLESRVLSRRRQTRQVDLVERDHRLGRRVLLSPAICLEIKPHAQGVVVLHDGGHGAFQGGGGEGLARLQQEGVVEVMGVRWIGVSGTSPATGPCPAGAAPAGSVIVAWRASPATVWCSKICRTVKSRPAWRARATIWTERIESPPSSK